MVCRCCFDLVWFRKMPVSIVESIPSSLIVFNMLQVWQIHVFAFLLCSSFLLLFRSHVPLSMSSRCSYHPRDGETHEPWGRLCRDAFVVAGPRYRWVLTLDDVCNLFDVVFLSSFDFHIVCRVPTQFTLSGNRRRLEVS